MRNRSVSNAGTLTHRLEEKPSVVVHVVHSYSSLDHLVKLKIPLKSESLST